MLRARRLRSSATNAVLLAVVAGLMYFFWPSSLGGCSTLTIVSGHSMEPTYRSGDLVWSRCGEPAVGDIVVYTPPDTDGAQVIHRIIGGDGVDGWVLQGDNNSFVDPWSPDSSLVVGVATVHVPRLGTVAYVLANPYVWGSLLLLATAIYLWPRSEAEIEIEADAEAAAETQDPAGDGPSIDDPLIDHSPPDTPPSDGVAPQTEVVAL